MLSTLIGTLGILIVSIGLLTNNKYKKLIIGMGPVLLLISAILDQENFYILFQFFIIIVSIFSFLKIKLKTKIINTILIYILFIILILNLDLINSSERIIGAVSMLSLGLAYASSRNILFLISGILIVIFTGIEVYKYNTLVPWLFLILNIIFSIAALIAVKKESK